MTNLTKTIANKSVNKGKSIAKQYMLTASITASTLTLAALSEAATTGSVGVIGEMLTSITSLIKTEGKLGLQILSAAAGGLAAAKTVSWQPLLVGGVAAGLIEILFTAIK